MNNTGRNNNPQQGRQQNQQNHQNHQNHQNQQNQHYNTYLDPKIWGKHYWFVLHTIAIIYPNNPNEFMKKKYYDFIQNIPLFLPNEKMGNTFLEYLDKYPVTPYLQNRISLMKWVHFIHNKINIALGKEEVNFYDAVNMYYSNYQTHDESIQKNIKQKYILMTTSFIVLTGIIAYFLYQ